MTANRILSRRALPLGKWFPELPLLFLSLLLLFVLAVVAPPQSGAGDEEEQVFRENCSLCHTLDRPRSKHLTRGEWQQIIDRMIGNGCPISNSRKKQEAVLGYLTRTQGPLASTVAQEPEMATPSTLSAGPPHKN